MQAHKCDVLVIGSGAAGLRTAIEAHDQGADVIVLGKCKTGDAHTVMATGGINAALGTMDPEDSWAIHAADTLKEGCFLADYRAVELLCRNAPQAIQDLVDYGVKFAKDRRGLVQRFFGAHTYRRTCFVGDHTGRAIEAALVHQAEKMKLQFLEEIYITALTKHGDKLNGAVNSAVNGAIGFDMKSDDMALFNAKVVVLATGGHSRIYRRCSSRMMENTGDGIGLAFEAGAELQDMEMIQFHPTGMVWPRKMEGTLVTEAVRAEGGMLYNEKGERFMEKYDPVRMELGPRNFVARCIYKEITEDRGSKHDGVWLDIRHKEKEYILERLPSVYNQFREHGIDMTQDLMEVAPTAHYSMGGIRVGLDGSTNVHGLYAVGEVTGGLHGANRLGGNSLSETMVFGKIVGEAAARTAKKSRLEEVSYREILEKTKETRYFLGKPHTENIGKLCSVLQETMWQYAGIIRSAKELHMALRNIEALKAKLHKLHAGRRMGKDFVALWDLSHMLVAAEAVVRSALLRKESRGAHYRKDYPVQDDRLLFNIVCTNYNSRMKLNTARVTHPHEEMHRMVKNMPHPVYRNVIE